MWNLEQNDNYILSVDGSGFEPGEVVNCISFNKVKGKSSRIMVKQFYFNGQAFCLFCGANDESHAENGERCTPISVWPSFAQKSHNEPGCKGPFEVHGLNMFSFYKNVRDPGWRNKQGKSGHVETCRIQTTKEETGRTRKMGATITGCTGGRITVVSDTGE